MPRILVIDDDPGVVNFLRRGLSLEGFEVWTATEGLAGLEVFEQVEPHLVILDRRLVGMGGLEVLERLRAAHPQVPVVLLSGSDPKPGEQVNPDVTYLVKPVNFDILISTIRSLLQGRGSNAT
ncbi:MULTISPECIES: response regulator transcription factor [unclassified Meiothermus]|uniref:response regulator transcription factor n=1 Tax=unclassified Meiothermus TaxID=370471 RepID=UPI000D7C51DF|nr:MULTISPECIES: response regulator [unclassified Meiothermus]PZA05861.1 hypothetical protein DNA98_16405 [Meiothermus sp. Pnk-1]RYM30743.1 response regulator [Meiothermus sp. PNK-Is4]